MEYEPSNKTNTWSSKTRKGNRTRCDMLTLVACHTNKKKRNKTATIKDSTSNTETASKHPLIRNKSSHVHTSCRTGKHTCEPSLVVFLIRNRRGTRIPADTLSFRVLFRFSFVLFLWGFRLHQKDIEKVYEIINRYCGGSKIETSVIVGRDWEPFKCWFFFLLLRT